MPVIALLAITAVFLARKRTPRDRVSSPARKLNVAAATLAASVVADSTLEHYRGGFYNPAMFIAPISSAATLTAAASAVRRGAARRPGQAVTFGAALAVGLAGFAFHVYDLTRRIGGWRWPNVFYGAPLGAPMALGLAGAMGVAANRRSWSPRALALGAATALLGTSAEAALLHFRGAFQDPFMWLPVTVPPAAALALAGAAARPSAARLGAALALLRVTAFLGFAGVAFHAFGVARNMGGWRNWSQNVLNGPPLPAPPSFTGVALAGMAALNLLERKAR